MNKLGLKSLFLVGGTFACLSAVSTTALANETIADGTVPLSTLNGEENTSPYSTFQVVQTDEEAEQGQVTSVSQLSDVQPTDWAYQALQSLVERYGCIAGYPNGTFRGNRAATRYELAAALNACLDQISDRFATKEDLEAVKALQEEFKAELATLKGRTDSLEARGAVLEAQQFSTTTKLVGEAIFQGVQTTNTRAVPAGFDAAGLGGFFGPIGDNFTFQRRSTLNFLTSFTGKDLLITSIQEGSYPISGFDAANGNFLTAQGSLAPSLNQTSQNTFGLYYLGYRFPIFNDRGTVFATAKGGEVSDFTDTLNPFFDSDGQGSLSGFGIRNPIYRHISGRLGSSGTGVGANFDITKNLNFAVGYLATDADASSSIAIPTISGASQGGLFGGDYSAIAQLTFKPTKSLGLGLTYVRTYQLSPNIQLGGGSGTFRANFPFLLFPTSANSASFQFSWEVTPRFALSGWVGATFANLEQSGVPLPTNTGVPSLAQDGDNATILNGALALAFPDLFGKGNLGGLIFGVEPQVVSSSIAGYSDPDPNFHIEALYRFRVNDFISITPGIIAIINPEGNSNNDPVIVGTVRTTFSF